MSNKYVIQWKSLTNGRAGRGSKVFSREEAEQLVRELNEEYPQILHEVISARDESEPVETVPARTGERETEIRREKSPEELAPDPTHAFSA
jgi:hypothetical protein